MELHHRLVHPPDIPNVLKPVATIREEMRGKFQYKREGKHAEYDVIE